MAQAHSTCAGIALGMVSLGAGGKLGPDAVQRLLILANGGTISQADLTPHDGHWSPCSVDTTVTSSGAVLALALAYMRTNDEVIAAAIAPPASPVSVSSIKIIVD